MLDVEPSAVGMTVVRTGDNDDERGPGSDGRGDDGLLDVPPPADVTADA